MSKKPTLTGNVLSYVQIEPSGSVSVDMEKFLKTQDGRARLEQLRQVAERMRERAVAPEVPRTQVRPG